MAKFGWLGKKGGKSRKKNEKARKKACAPAEPSPSSIVAAGQPIPDPCVLCSKDEDHSDMLVCSYCDGAFHFYCPKEPITEELFLAAIRNKSSMAFCTLVCKRKWEDRQDAYQEITFGGGRARRAVNRERANLGLAKSDPERSQPISRQHLDPAIATEHLPQQALPDSNGSVRIPPTEGPPRCVENNQEDVDSDTEGFTLRSGHKTTDSMKTKAFVEQQQTISRPTQCDQIIVAENVQQQAGSQSNRAIPVCPIKESFSGENKQGEGDSDTEVVQPRLQFSGGRSRNLSRDRPTQISESSQHHPSAVFNAPQNFELGETPPQCSSSLLQHSLEEHSVGQITRAGVAPNSSSGHTCSQPPAHSTCASSEDHSKFPTPETQSHRRPSSRSPRGATSGLHRPALDHASNSNSSQPPSTGIFDFFHHT